jgi:acetate kinase
MKDALLVLNAGSSSLKFSLHESASLDRVVRGQLEGLGTQAYFLARDAEGTILGERRWQGPLEHEGALEYLREWLKTREAELRISAVGHRVVHGGMRHSAPQRVDSELVAELQALAPLAPLHQPHNLAPIRAIAAADPALPQVACFDTAFHRTQSPVAQAFALPRRFTEAGVQRYGFHGLSYEYIVSALPAYDRRAAQGRTIVLHLGAGSSACALQTGRSVATTMGFTALDGLPMGTRCGNLDPGVILYLLQHEGMSAKEIEHLLYHESGLKGVSGISADMRDLLGSPVAGARAAVELYAYRICREIGSLAAALGGLDALVFTAGIGERAAEVRTLVGNGCAWLGVKLDEAANAAQGPRLSSADSRVAVWAIPTDEEMIIARHTREVLGV